MREIDYMAVFRRLSPWLTLALLSLVVRCFRVNDWLLPNVDEIVLMNTMNLRFLEGCNTSSAFWPAHLILRSFFFLHQLCEYRLISVITGTGFILVVFAIARRLVAAGWAWAFCAFLSVQWYFLYMSRIVEIASFMPLCIAGCLYLLVRWRETGRVLYVHLFCLLGGIGANLWTPPMFYLVGATMAFLFWETARRRFAWGHLVLALAVLIVALAPYLVVLIREAHIRDDILMRYQMTASSGTAILPANLLHPAAAAKTWTHLATWFQEQLPWKWLVPVAMLPLLPLVFGRWVRLNRILSLFLWLVWLQLALLALSPVPLYIEGHAAPLYLLLLLLLLGLASSSAPRLVRRACVLSLAATLVASFGFAPCYLGTQQTRLRDWLEDNVAVPGARPVCVSDGAYLKLTKIPGIVALNLTYAVYTCAPDELFWTKHSPAEFPIIISTYECNMDADVRRKGYCLSHELTMNNLYEAHLRHGIDVWRVSRPKTGTNGVDSASVPGVPQRR